MAGFPARHAVLLLGAALALTSCAEGERPGFLQGLGKGGGEPAAEGDAEVSRSTRLVERDVEAPEVFQVTESALWDGRPSLGGVWVAYPDVTDPERVLIRNQENDRFVIGALFRRERETPGPKLQLSSDAADALGVLAGQPVQVNVTALRREEVPISGETAAEDGTGDGAATLDAPERIAATPLDGEAAPDARPAEIQPASAAPAAAPAPAPAKRAAAASLDRPYIQIGIFSVEENAENTATSLRQIGVVPSVKKQTTQGKSFWRVIVGPSSSEADRAAILDKVKDLGFSDAYFVAS